MSEVSYCSLPNKELTEINIRNAVEEDFETISSIYAYHVQKGTGSFEIEPPSVEEMLHRWHKVLDWGGIWVTAVDSDGIIGYAYAGPHSTREAYRDTVEDSIYICPRVVGKGVGTKLLTALITACKKERFSQMVSVIGDSENTASIKLHEKLGFVHCGSFKSVGKKFGVQLDVVFMQKEL